MTPQLWSLWDMLPLYADLFALMSYQSGVYDGRSQLSQEYIAEYDRVLAKDDPEIAETWDGFVETLFKSEFNASAMACKDIARLKRKQGVQNVLFREAFSHLHKCLTAELKSRLCFVIRAGDGHFFTEPNGFGDEVATSFPDAIGDIEEAGKCLALQRGTACVFHLMRVLEIGLRRLEERLGIQRVKDESWQAILNGVNKAIDKLPFQTQAQKDYRAFFAASAAHLQNVKNAWRNDVAHPRSSYTPEEAWDIWNHTKALMGTLTKLPASAP